jgi:hypothetical protein
VVRHVGFVPARRRALRLTPSPSNWSDVATIVCANRELLYRLFKATLQPRIAAAVFKVSGCPPERDPTGTTFNSRSPYPKLPTKDEAAHDLNLSRLMRVPKLPDEFEHIHASVLSMRRSDLMAQLTGVEPSIRDKRVSAGGPHVAACRCF